MVENESSGKPKLSFEDNDLPERFLQLFTTIRLPPVTEKSIFGVYYHCRQLEEGCVCTRPIWNDKIRDFLKDVKIRDPIYGAIVGIRSLNHESVIEHGVETMIKYLEQLRDSKKSEENFTIDMNSEEFLQNISNLECAMDLLKAIGFIKVVKNRRNLLVHYDYIYKKKNIDIIIYLLQKIEGFKLELDRNGKMYTVTEYFKADPYIPVDFYLTTPVEIEIEKRMRESKRRAEMNFRCLFNLLKSKRKPLYTRINIKIPNNYVLQGIFSVNDTLADVREFIEDIFHVERPYELTSLELYQDKDAGEKTLGELDLAPSGVIEMKIENEVSLNCTDPEPIVSIDKP